MELVGERKLMKKFVFVVTAIAALGLAGCNRSNQDSVNNADVNQPAAEDLNALSNGAATDANAEAAALGNQQAELNSENAAADDTTNPTDEQEQNVSGM
jgi:outer membrane lipoprotein SlyB